MTQNITGLDAYILSHCPTSAPGIEVSELVRRCGHYERVIQELILSGDLHRDTVTGRVWIPQNTNPPRKSASEIVLELTLAGKHQEADLLAKQVIAMYQEDATGDGSKDDGKCNDCGYEFTDNDCQHGEFEPLILCDRCYLDRGGR